MNVGHQSATRLCLPILLLAGCGSVPDQRSELDATIERYYEVHASEPTDACLAPYIDAIRATQVVEDEPARLVVEVRYRYRDRIRRAADLANARTTCTGDNQRRFVLARNGDSITVEAMSGPKRG
jgi:hypothetical protein